MPTEESHCRLCSARSNLISMFSGKSRNYRHYFRKIIHESMGISIEQDDFTTTVCLNCLLDVTYLHLFKLHCLQNQDKLKALETASPSKLHKFKFHASTLKNISSPDFPKTEEAFNWLKAKRSSIAPLKVAKTFFDEDTQTTVDWDCKATQVDDKIEIKSSGSQTNFQEYLKDSFCQTLQTTRALNVFNENYIPPLKILKDGSVQTELEQQNGESDTSSSSEICRLPFKKRRRILNGERKKKEHHPMNPRSSDVLSKMSQYRCNKRENVVQANNSSNEAILKWLNDKEEPRSNVANKEVPKMSDGQDKKVKIENDFCFISTQKSDTKVVQRKNDIVVKNNRFFDMPQTPTSKRKTFFEKNINPEKIATSPSPNKSPACDISRTIGLEVGLISADDIKKEQISPSTSTSSTVGGTSGLLQVNPTKLDLVEICGLCGKTLYNKREIKMHEKRHTQCHICKKKFKSVPGAMRHLSWCKMKAVKKEQSGAYVNLVRIEEMKGVREKYVGAFEGLGSSHGSTQ